MSNFKNAIDGVTKALSGSKCAPFIEFTVGNLKMTTYSKLDYFMQLDVDYAGTGIGSANKFTVSMAYVPKPYQDPNAIDKALAGVTADNAPCYLRYGYSGIKGYNLVTQEYECIVLGYSISIRDSIIYYTITGVSTAMTFREKRHNFPAIENQNPLSVIRAWGNAYTQDVKLKMLGYDTGFGGKEGFRVEIANNADEYVQDQNIKEINDVTVFEYLDTVLMNLEDKTDPNAVYWYSISDIKGRQTVVIHRTSVKTSSYKNLYDNNQILFTFDWGGNHQDNKTNNLVKAFETEFKGEVNIATTNDIIETRYAYDSSGNMVQVTGMEEFDVGDFVKEDSVLSTRRWARSLDWSYNASIELEGIPADIPIGAIIEINPMFYGQKHHTAGYYMIIGAKCNITSSGFSTNLNLFKVIIDSTSLNYGLLKDNIVKSVSGAVNLISDAVGESDEEKAKKNSNLTFSGKDYVYSPDAFKEEVKETTSKNETVVSTNPKATRNELTFSGKDTPYMPNEEEDEIAPIIDPKEEEMRRQKYR